MLGVWLDTLLLRWVGAWWILGVVGAGAWVTRVLRMPCSRSRWRSGRAGRREGEQGMT